MSSKAKKFLKSRRIDSEPLLSNPTSASATEGQSKEDEFRRGGSGHGWRNSSSKQGREHYDQTKEKSTDRRDADHSHSTPFRSNVAVRSIKPNSKQEII